MDLLPNAMSFRVVTSIDVADLVDVPTGFTGRARLLRHGVLVEIAWFAHGALHDPARLVPAHARYRPNGSVKWERFYQGGVLHDPVSGRPAVRGFYATGVHNYEEYFQRGRRHDAPGGAAAITKWRPDGSVRRRLHFDRDQLVSSERVTRQPRPWVTPESQRSLTQVGH